MIENSHSDYENNSNVNCVENSFLSFLKAEKGEATDATEFIATVPVNEMVELIEKYAQHKKKKILLLAEEDKHYSSGIDTVGFVYLTQLEGIIAQV